MVRHAGGTDRFGTDTGLAAVRNSREWYTLSLKQAPVTPRFNPQNANRGRMNTARRLLSATLVGCLVVFFTVVIGCASTRAVGEPPVETASSPPVVDPAPSPPIGPPPGYVKPENYWVREKIILGEVTRIVEQPMSPEPAPLVSAPPKRVVNRGKKHNKTGKRFTESDATRTSATAEVLVQTPGASFMPGHPVATFSAALRSSRSRFC